MERNKRKTAPRAADIVGKRVLIIGESGSGKTKLAAQLLKELTSLVGSEKITVIDLAPKRIGEIGGRLKDYTELTKGIRNLSPAKVYAPRLTGTSSEEVLHYAKLNRKTMEPLLSSYVQNPSDVLILNDVTLYLHSGELETVLSCARLAKTFLATAYYGSRLSEDLGTGISSRERRLADELAASMDLVVRID